MGKKTNEIKSTEMNFINSAEQAEIERRVDFELIDKQYQLVKLGTLISLIGGIIVSFAFFHKVKTSLLLGWYGALLLVGISIISFAFYYERHKPTPSQIKPWRNAYRVMEASICIVWGSISILFLSNDIQYQFYLVFILFILIVGIGLGNIMDFITSATSITLISTPFIVYWTYAGIKLAYTNGSYSNLKFQFGICLFVLGIFLLVESYVGFKLIRKTIKLSFINIALSKKLENVNKHLEQKVKERTVELEDSLKKVTYQATHDLLTNLPNSRMLTEYMKTAIKSANGHGHSFAIAFFSLNEMQRINDGLGHQVGDQVTYTIAQRFQRIFSKKENGAGTIHYTVTLSRKDEFVILIDPIIDVNEVEAKARLLFSVLDEPIHTKAQAIKLTACIGISLYPRDGKDIKTLLMNADAAILSKKIGGNSLHVYKAELNADISKQLELESDLYSAVGNNEFTIHYQPFVDLRTGQVCGMEALVRWLHPTLGFISPMNFIQLAEANGVIIPLGEWILRTACLQTKAWHDQGFSTLKVSVNLSAKQLQHRNIVQVVENVLQETGLKPQYLELELTETEAFKEEAMPVLRKFTEMGVGLLIDDFGTGYSGLSNLKLLTIEKLKIDKSFVDDIDTNDHSRAIVVSTIALARELKIKTLAEGIETKEQLKVLKEIGCDMMQGYYFSKPVDVDAFTKLLVEKRSLPIDEIEGATS